ncbi:MAG TPA: methyltransferase domain-containing protein [Solirubrobacteraceae bacterium]|nr:methyltransferase domain-containing protein [Solirubrobacteraceae bacterium]
MSTMATRAAHEDYVLGRSAEEYERLRAQSRVWEAATGRLFDRVELGRGARCLDAGCGPGEVMRLMAQRVGPAGYVCGVDVDGELGAQAVAMLQLAGHRQCAFATVDLERAEAIPGAPFDHVYARLLLFHVGDPVAVLRSLWAATAPGGVLVVHDYDLRTADTLPTLATVEEWKRVVLGAFSGAGRDIHVGHRLPRLFANAGIGAPDGTDVAGRLEPLRAAGGMFAAVYRSLLPAAQSLGLTTADEGAHWLEAFERDMREHCDHAALWPLLIGAWKRKPR